MTDVEGDLVKKEENQKQTIATKETKPNRSQAAFQTPKSDVRIIDKQQAERPGDDSSSHLNKHYRGWLIPITINQLSTLALLDTGATCTIIGRPQYETLQAVQPLQVKQDEDLHLEVIGGDTAPTLGTATVQIVIVRGSYEQEVVISANRENPNCILGSDFFCQHDCELPMWKQQFQVGDRQIRCVPELEHVVKAGLKIARRVELPARTEVIVPYKPTHASSGLQKTAAIAQPCSNQWRYAEDGIVIGSALKTPDQSETVIPVMNLTLCIGAPE